MARPRVTASSVIQAIPPWANQAIQLYHGTADIFRQSILRGVNPQAGNPSADFGLGFYVTTNLRQARRWANIVAGRKRSTPAVIQFIADRELLAALETLCFVRGAASATDFWSFVRHCPLGGDHQRAHPRIWYDVVVGPVARNWADWLRVHDDYDQVSFHTARAASFLDSCQPRVLR
jgi:hypothetical protein